MQQKERVLGILDRFGAEGVAALATATPSESGETARSWYYEVTQGDGGYSLVFRNSHVNDGEPIVILIQHGHGTGTGGYVSPRPFINEAIQPIFDRLGDEIWKAVTTA